jgi:hypothetical protein
MFFGSIINPRASGKFRLGWGKGKLPYVDYFSVCYGIYASWPAFRTCKIGFDDGRR